MQTKCADALLANSFYVKLNVAGKSVESNREVPVAELASQLTTVLVEKGIAASTVESESQTLARFR